MTWRSELCLNVWTGSLFILLFHTVASENSLKLKILNLSCVLLSVKQHDWLIYDELTTDFKFLTTWWRYILSSFSSGLKNKICFVILPAVWNTNSFHLFALWSCENKPHSGERWRSATCACVGYKTNTASYKKLKGYSILLLIIGALGTTHLVPLLCCWCEGASLQLFFYLCWSSSSSSHLLLSVF